MNAPRSSFGTRRRRRSHLCRKGSAQLDLPRAHRNAPSAVSSRSHGRRLPLQRRPARRAVRRAAPERVCRIRSPRELRVPRARELARNGARGSVGRPERRRVPSAPTSTAPVATSASHFISHRRRPTRWLPAIETVWLSGRTCHPLPELMVLGELAQAAAERRSTLGIDEAGLIFAARFAELTSGKRSRVSFRTDARDRRRAVETALWIVDEHAGPTSQSGSKRLYASSGIEHIPFPASLLGGPRGEPAPVPGPVAAPSRGPSPRRARTSDHESIAYEVGFGDLSNFVRTFRRAAGVSPRMFRRASSGDRKILQERIASSS